MDKLQLHTPVSEVILVQVSSLAVGQRRFGPVARKQVCRDVLTLLHKKKCRRPFDID